jgi:general secretion pathway protein M
MTLTGVTGRAKLVLSEFWSARDYREQILLSVALVLLGLALMYALLIAPALEGRKQLHKDLPLLRQQVAQMQLLSKEVAEFAEKPAATANPVDRVSIEASLARNGLKLQDMQFTGNFVKVQLAAVSFTSILSWVEEMRKTSHLLVDAANIVALSQPDTVDATLTLNRTRNE